jgi:photosystem II stability/assembly factor-like uncharacterized protein
MKRVLILLLGISLMAASCDVVNTIFGTTGGTRGVFKSSDNGESYHTANALTKGDIGGVSVSSLNFDSANPQIIYLSSTSGLYKSTNSGESWSYILSGLSSAKIVTDPFDPTIVYAVGVAGINGKIVKSFDSGSSWVDIYTEPSKNNPVLAFDISKSSSSILLAGLASGQIIRSTDAGHTWQASKDLSNRILSLDYATTGEAYALTLNKGLFKSSDNGVTWSELTATLTGQSVSIIGQPATTANQFDQLGLDRRQAGVLYLATDEGLFRSVNNGKSWATVALPLKNSALRVSSVAVSPNDSNVVFVAVGSTIFKSHNGGVTWETKVLTTGAEIKKILIDPQSSNFVYIGVGNPR